MNALIYATPALSVLAVNVVLGIYVLWKNPQGRLNRLYSLICLAFAVWASGDAVRTIGGDQQAGVVGAWLITSGFALTVPSLLHFALALTEKKGILAKKATYLWLYGPSAAYVFLERFTDLISRDPMQKTYVGYMVSKGSVPWINLPWVGGYLLVALYICWRFYRQTGDQRKRKSLRLFFAGFFMTFIVGFIGDGILYQVFRIIIPVDFTVVLSVFLSVLVARAVVHYGFLEVTPEMAAKTLIRTMPGFLVVVNGKMDISIVNSGVLNAVGYAEGELRGQPWTKLFADQTEAAKALAAAGKGAIGIEAEYLTKEGKKIPVSIGISPIKDRTGAFLGAVSVGQDMREFRDFVKQLQHSKKTAEEQRDRAEELGRELKERYEEAEKISKLLIDRELKMVELKRENEDLSKELKKTSSEKPLKN